MKDLVLEEQYMHRCFSLAAQGLGKVSPNPMVGCVLVRNGFIVGEGFHELYGGKHAEPQAIAQLESQFGEESAKILSECTLYVNLEPCAHHGKTPPCADLIIEKGIKKVVICNRDPFELVNGRGIEKLREAGVEVTIGIKELEGRKLNQRFFTFHEKKRPYIILKWAITADGFMAPLDRSRRQISGKQAQMMLHQWRSEEDAILVGKTTFLNDQPQLNSRLVQGKNPTRCIIDSKLQLPETAYGKAWVFNTQKNAVIGDTEFIKVDEQLFLGEVMHHLFLRNQLSLIVEGGPFTLEKFIQHQLVDEMRIFKSKYVRFGEGISGPIPMGNKVYEEEVGDDILKEYLL